MMLPAEAVQWTSQLLAVAVFLQSWELLRLRNWWGDQGIWRWSDLREQFANPLAKKILDAVLSQQPFRLLLISRLIAAAILWIAPLTSVAAIWIAITTVLIGWRWRGSFNGGSDSMTLIVAVSVSAALFFRTNPKIVLGAIWFLALQLALSYFIAGIVKIKNPAWRSGEALRKLLRSPRYAPPKLFQKLADRPGTVRILAWGMLLFECLFPIGFLNPQIGVLLLKIGIVFHLANVYLLGLNRFFWIWLAAYPAFYSCLFLLL